MAAYKHQPLHGPRNTRLIWLEPSKIFSAPLQCRLLEISSDESHRYEALSYTWGAPVMSGTVYCSNAPLGITANCEAAMRHLRLSGQPRLLWIDAICIDQESSAEKNQQIPLMKDIYGKAEEVLVWLGEETKASKNAIILLTGNSRQTLVPSMEYSRDGNFDLPTTGLKLIANAIAWCILMVVVKPVLTFCIRVPSKKKHSPANQEEGGGGALFSFFSRSVFERMWCTQEIAMGRRVRLVLGKKSMTWEQLVTALNYTEMTTQAIINSSVTQRVYKGRIALQEKLRNVIRPSPNQASTSWPPLSSLLNDTRSRGATNPRDKVYALYGILELMGLRLPPVDTSKPVWQIYQEMTQTAFATDGNLNMLCQITGLADAHSLPSWVPDLSCARPPAMLNFEAYNASKSSPISWHVPPSSSTLMLHGRVVDRVRAVGEVMDGGVTEMNTKAQEPSVEAGPLPSTSESTTAFRIFHQWLSIAQTLPSTDAKHPITSIFAATLLTNPASVAKASLSSLLSISQTWLTHLASSTSHDLLLEPGISNMLDDVSSLPVTAHEQREYASQIVAATLVMLLATKIGMQKRARALHHWLYLCLRGCTFFITEGGLMGIASGDCVKVGDAVALFSGLKVPFVARDIGDGKWRLVSPAYAEGIMQGEAWDESQGLHDFSIV